MACLRLFQYRTAICRSAALLIWIVAVSSCADVSQQRKLLIGQWENEDKGHVFWVQFSEDGTFRGEGVAGDLNGKWKLTRGLLELEPYYFESKVPELTRRVKFHVSDQKFHIEGEDVAGGPRFVRAK
jgi:hypothetical protein